MSNPEEQSTPPSAWRNWLDGFVGNYKAFVLGFRTGIAQELAKMKEFWANQVKPFVRETPAAVKAFLTGILALFALVLLICWVMLPIKEARDANARADAAERVVADLRQQISALSPVEGPGETLQPVAIPRPKPARPAAPDDYDGLYGGQSPSEIIDEAMGFKPSPSSAWITPTDLDRRLAEFQKRIDATPSPNL